MNAKQNTKNPFAKDGAAPMKKFRKGGVVQGDLKAVGRNEAKIRNQKSK